MKNVKLSLKAGLGVLVFLMAFSFTASAQSTTQADVKAEKHEVITTIKTPVASDATSIQLFDASTTTNVSMKTGSKAKAVGLEKHAIDPNKVLIITEQNGKRIQSSKSN